MLFSIPRAATAATVCLMIGLASTATAGTIVVDVSASSNWRATQDAVLGGQWAIGNFNDTDGSAAVSPSIPGPPSPNMWIEGGLDYTVDPDDFYGAVFGLSFEVKEGARVDDGGFNIIADDYFDLVINGQLVASALLEDQPLDMMGQRVPLSFDFATLEPFFQTGTNVIAIRALDGFRLDDPTQDCTFGGQQGIVVNTAAFGFNSFCAVERVNQYVHVQGSLSVLPEPNALLLVGLGSLLLGGFARIRRR